MWETLKEGSSVLPSMKQVTPSERSGVSGNEGTGDRSELGKAPVSGQSKIWGNLNNQSRGMTGTLDTQGKESPEMFTSKKGATKDNDPGTSIPGAYKKMYTVHEAASGAATGQQSGKFKSTSATKNNGVNNASAMDADTNHGGSTNCSCDRGKKSTMTEAQLIGSTVAMIASNLLSENLGFKFPRKK